MRGTVHSSEVDYVFVCICSAGHRDCMSFCGPDTVY